MWRIDYKFIFIIIILLLILIALNINLVGLLSEIKVGSAESSGITWKNQKIYSPKEIINLVGFIEGNIKKFEPISPGEMKTLNKYAKQNKIPVGELISLRHIIATQKSINAKKKSHQYDREVKDSFDSGNVAKFFDKFPIPPLEIMKMLKGHGLKLDPKFLNYAEEHDSESSQTRDRILKDADLFENNLTKWIKINYPDIKFKTQNQLIREQTDKFGRPFATPDILFDEPVLIKVTDSHGVTREHLVKWIDAKNFTLLKVPFILDHVKKQAEKYLRNYGPGALAFHYGFTQGINIPQTLLLDASFIN